MDLPIARMLKIWCTLALSQVVYTCYSFGRNVWSTFCTVFFFIGVQKWNWKKLRSKKSSHSNCTRATFDDDDDDAQKTHKNDGRLCGGGGRDFAVVRRLRFGGGFVFSGGG